MRERKDREAQRESKRRRGEGHEQEFPIKIFLSAVAVGWLLRQFRGIDSKGGGGKREKNKREKNKREKRQRGIERVREGEGRAQ